MAGFSILGAAAGGFADEALRDKRRKFESDVAARGQFAEMLMKLAGDESTRPETRQRAFQKAVDTITSDKPVKFDVSDLVAPAAPPKEVASASAQTSQMPLPGGQSVPVTMGGASLMSPPQPPGMYIDPETKAFQDAQRAQAIAEAQYGTAARYREPHRFPTTTVERDAEGNVTYRPGVMDAQGNVYTGGQQVENAEAAGKGTTKQAWRQDAQSTTGWSMVQLDSAGNVMGVTRDVVPPVGYTGSTSATYDPLLGTTTTTTRRPNLPGAPGTPRPQSPSMGVQPPPPPPGQGGTPAAPGAPAPAQKRSVLDRLPPEARAQLDESARAVATNPEFLKDVPQKERQLVRARMRELGFVLLDKGAPKQAQEFSGALEAVNQLRQYLDEYENASDSKAAAIALYQFHNARQALSIVVGKQALGEVGVFTNQDRATYAKMLGPMTAITAVDPAIARKFLGDIDKFIKRVENRTFGRYGGFARVEQQLRQGGGEGSVPAPPPGSKGKPGDPFGLLN